MSDGEPHDRSLLNRGVWILLEVSDFQIRGPVTQETVTGPRVCRFPTCGFTKTILATL
jgi:hypothetical protein